MNIIILGQAGSGKGTQAEMLAQKFNLEHFDTGKILRQIAKMDNELGREVHEIINIRKELVSNRVLKAIMHNRLADTPTEQGFVFDGVPRNLDHASYFSSALLEFGRKIDKVFFINISEEESIRRISSRRVCEDCRKVLIMGRDVKNETDACPACNGKIMHRIDDTIDGIKKRLAVFNEETLPVINFYKEQDVLVEINGEQEIQKVAADIIKNIEQV